MSDQRRVIGYIRVSTTEQAENGYGLPGQRQAIVDYCRREGLELFDIFEDAGVKGALPLPERPGLLAALFAVRERKEDPIPVTGVVTKFNRIGRDAFESLTAERQFGQMGAPVLYVDGLNGEGPQLKFMRHVMHGVSELEKDLLVAQMRLGKEMKAAKGGYVGGAPPFGWKPEGKELVIDEDATPALVGAFKSVAAGHSLAVTARLMRERGVPGRKWRAGGLNRIIRDPRYKLGTHPLVDPRIWNKANAELDRRRPKVHELRQQRERQPA